MKNDPFNLPPLDFFDYCGNNECGWHKSAHYLIKSASLIYNNIGNPPKFDKINVLSSLKKSVDWVHFHGVARMLRGMALECLLKAVWLHFGGILAKNGKFTGIPHAKNHDLFLLYKAVHPISNLIFDKDELLLLSRFSFSIIHGRYPIQKSFESYPSAPVPTDEVKWNYTHYREDNRAFRKMIKKIDVLLKSNKP